MRAVIGEAGNPLIKEIISIHIVVSGVTLAQQVIIRTTDNHDFISWGRHGMVL